MCGPASSETAESEPHSGDCQCSEQEGERFNELAVIFSLVQLCVYSLCLACLVLFESLVACLNSAGAELC